MIFVFIIIVLFIVIQIFTLYYINKNNNKAHQFSELPKVSILLAVRNEENNIIRCLEGLISLDYPKELLEILIGNDQSEDNTNSIIENFIKSHSNCKLIQISNNIGKGRGKANVLGQLAHHASGKYYFITDADVLVPKLWIKDMLSMFEPKVGIVSGTTITQSNTIFGMMQDIDWLHFMSYIKSFANKGIACTSVGNNMAVLAEAYWQTGGYEKIDFSITEDYKLFEAVTSNKWDWRTIHTENTLCKALPIYHILEFLHQRKRWLIGAKDLPLLWKILLILYGLFYPILIYLTYKRLYMGLMVFIIKMMLQYLFIKKSSKILNIKEIKLNHLFLYEIYLWLTTIFTTVFYFLPIQSKWKGRRYSKNYIQ